MRNVRSTALLLSVLMSAAGRTGAQSVAANQTKPPITLDEFMNATEILGAKISMDVDEAEQGRYGADNLGA
jgi:hypothetical protein